MLNDVKGAVIVRFVDIDGIIQFNSIQFKYLLNKCINTISNGITH